MADLESTPQRTNPPLAEEILPPMPTRPPPLAEGQAPHTASPTPSTPSPLSKSQGESDSNVQREKNVRFNTPPPSPPPLLRRTTGHLPERRLGSTSSVELQLEVSPVSPVSPLGATATDHKSAEKSPPATPERASSRRKSFPTTPPSDRTLRRAPGSASISPTSSKKLPFSDTKSPEPQAKTTRTRTDDLPIPLSPSEPLIAISPSGPHPDHDLPIPTPPLGEEKIPFHPTRTNSTAISTTSTFIEKPPTTPGIAVPVSKTHSHHPERSSATTGDTSYKGRLWSDWHWHRNQDLPVSPAHQPGVADEELERKRYVSPYPKHVPLIKEGQDGDGKDWKKLNENMHYGGESGRGRRRREDNVSFK
ncbi:hypothetical protein L211DRAFT_302498 [Terfezia boudieri ATCC MYA-4762]|uniref:Uncharacterized protein n=1 Tax=Terfezia boudieri ATCC MYA-4762 TaxID=1051890 RepID=A0A3N4LIR0_9PEZI|nr:hypothetical protein L211DRAFT_302498 [Terfezia boudieri ATCC MYA-4762]